MLQFLCLRLKHYCACEPCKRHKDQMSCRSERSKKGLSLKSVKNIRLLECDLMHLEGKEGRKDVFLHLGFGSPNLSAPWVWRPESWSEHFKISIGSYLTGDAGSVPM